VKEKKKLIVWSGGFDSTALIIKALQENEPFDIIYIKLENNDIKNKIELNTRNKIKKLLSPFMDNVSDAIPITLILKSYPYLPQPMSWVFGISIYIADILRHKNRMFDYSEIEMGYIKNDDFWHISNQFKNSYYSLLSMDLIDKKDIPKLSFPIEWYKKEDLYYNFYSKNDLYKNVMNLTWTCEKPKLVKKFYVECGQCNTCKHRAELKKLLNLTDKDFKIKINEKDL